MTLTASLRISSIGRATALWMASTLSAAVLAFSATSSSRVFSAAATSRLKISRNCRSLSLKARDSMLSTLKVPITSSCSKQRDGQRTLRPADAFEEQRVFGRVLAKVALAGGGHETGHAVALGQREQVAHCRVGVQAHGQERLQAVGLAVQEADLGHFEVQQVLGEVDDVRLEKLDPVADRHLEDFFRRQVGQFHAGLVDGGQLLLLLDLVGHVADGNDQVPGGTLQLADRGGLHLEIAVVVAAQRGTGSLAGGQRRVEGTEVGTEDFGAAQGGVEVQPDHRIAAAPLPHAGVAPDDRVVAFQQGHAVGHSFQNLLILQELADFEGLAGSTWR